MVTIVNFNVQFSDLTIHRRNNRLKEYIEWNVSVSNKGEVASSQFNPLTGHLILPFWILRQQSLFTLSMSLITNPSINIMESLSDCDTNDDQLTSLSEIMDKFNLWPSLEEQTISRAPSQIRNNEPLNLLDDLKQQPEKTLKILSLLSKLSSVGVSVEEKITLMQKLLTLDTESLTEVVVIRMLSEERGDLVSCLVRIINIYTDTATNNREMLLKLMLTFHNNCLGKS